MTVRVESAAEKFELALLMGRPPNVVRLFPNSRALIVSGKVVDRALVAKGRAMTIAANARNRFVLYGALRAAERANAALILEIARSEGGADAYCAVNLWNLATFADAAMNELGITVPVAIHADHYAIQGEADVADARREIPSLFDAGVTSIALDASHLPDDQNLLATAELAGCVPGWAGLETEVGEIKGEQGLSTVDEALYLVRGLNAHGVFPDWIALNNGTTHGLQDRDTGIHVELTAKIHRALAPYRVSGAQHGTSGNGADRLRRIARETRTTKANVATALQFASWGVQVDDDGNAVRDDRGEFVKLAGVGATSGMWARMTAYAAAKGWQGGDYKKLNLPFENRLWAQPREVREGMIQAVEGFVYRLLTEVFDAADTAPLAIDAILAADSHDLGPKGTRLEDPAEWTPARAAERARALARLPTPGGDFSD
ncbi:MAG: class II fructose-bisphosphate aldolase [Deferrisomatales bacterium]